MDWFINLFTDHTFVQALLIISLICALGLALGNIKFFGVSLGAIFVFFAGIGAGHFGLEVNPDMLMTIQNFGLILYIYTLGVQVGPGFFSSLKQGGIKLNMLGFLRRLVGSLMSMIFCWPTNTSAADTVGLLSGAATNTPMLGAGQQALLQVNPNDIEGSNKMAMACAVAYPTGLVGVIACVLILKSLFDKKSDKCEENSADNTFVSEYQISNPAIFGKTIQEIRKSSSTHFVITRIWNGGRLIIPTSETRLEEDEHILVISSKNDVENIKTLFGHKEDKDWNRENIDWNAIDSQLKSKKVLVTKPELNGITLGSLKLRNSYGINITRVNRAGIDLFPSRSLRLQLGDKLTIVGEDRSIANVSE